MVFSGVGTGVAGLIHGTHLIWFRVVTSVTLASHAGPVTSLHAGYPGYSESYSSARPVKVWPYSWRTTSGDWAWVDDTDTVPPEPP